MSVLVTGSVAVDHIMVFEDHFHNHFVGDKLEKLNVAFHVPDMSKQYGGTGANIAFNLRRLGIDPILLAAVGPDLGAYGEWMDRHGLRRDYLRVIDDEYTASAFITTDAAKNQIISFHPGAMDRAHEASVSDVAEPFSVGIVSPNGKQAMIEYARDLKARGVRWIFDPGQGLPILEPAELLTALEGASVFIVNEYEWELTREKTGLDEEAISAKVGALVVTRGEDGSWGRRGGWDAGLGMEGDRLEVAPVKAEQAVDPTGCGDAYRAGLLYALAHDLPIGTGVQLGSLMGSLKVARPGPQSIELDLPAIRECYRNVYGEGF
ncbi:MAG: carbohydrate kinase family protein [Deltaproteobacteria bacterium]|jgi:adenosine kinase|nr:carbohydrate kinase family protein [Deltaproteobacteria bacterium]